MRVPPGLIRRVRTQTFAVISRSDVPLVDSGAVTPALLDVSAMVDTVARATGLDRVSVKTLLFADPALHRPGGQAFVAGRRGFSCVVVRRV